MSDLIASLNSWFQWLIIVVAGHGSTSSQRKGLIDALFINFWGANTDLNLMADSSAPFWILIIVAPVVIFGVIGIFKRFLSKN